jgi:hypothetical protein
MDISALLKKNIKIVVALVIGMVALPLAYSVVCFALSSGTQSARPFIEVPTGACVREAKWMRFNHWHVLYEARDEAMRQGVEPGVTFKECRRCHTSRERFCDKCHDVVNFNPDCFGCHYYP